jgi:hypothetical protein
MEQVGIDEETDLRLQSAADLTQAPTPGEAEASPIPGLDMPAFRNLLMRALTGDETIPSAILTRVTDILREQGSQAKQRDAGWWEDLFRRQLLRESLRAIDALISRYSEMADWHHGQAEEARARMTEAADKLTAIDEFISGADQALDDQRGVFDREKAVRLLRSRGVSVDPKEDEEALRNRLLIEQKKAQDERRRWSGQYDEASADANYHDAQERENRKKAQELIERLDAIRKSGYGPQEEGRLLREVTEEYKPDVQRRAAQIERMQNGDAEQGSEIISVMQKGVDTSSVTSEEADFMAAADGLTSKFAAVAANVPQDKPAPLQVVRHGAPVGNAPGSSV